MSELADAIRAGDRRSLARAITLVESTRPDHREEAVALLDKLLPATGGAVRVGVSGAPGAGKSTFIEALGIYLVDHGHRLAVLAVDPSSSRSGGSILGDKTRMERLSSRDEAFIRPSPSGGTLGGVARRTREALLLCEAAGHDVVLVETVGVGQDEVDIVKAADTTVVVMVPGLGDDIQAIKAGILEIGDVFVVNKADREGADRTAAEIGTMLDFTPDRAWRPPIVRTIAPSGTGVEETIEAIESHGEFLRATEEGARRRLRRARSRLLQLLEERFRRDVEASAPQPRGLEEAVEELLARREDPYTAAARLYGKLMRA